MPYRILLPEKFDRSKRYPLVVFLHGSGERGSDNEKQLIHGAKLFLDPENRRNYPAIVVFPQCAGAGFWSNTQFLFNDKDERSFYFLTRGEPSGSMKLLQALIANLFVQYKIKKDQVYAMGISMGGMGTFELVNRMPHTFAAAIPICGGAHPSTAANLKNTGWWIFHGARDDIVPSKYSENMVKAMKRHGVPVKFTLYPDADHNSWDPALSEPTILKWLFSKKLRSKLSDEYNN